MFVIKFNFLFSLCVLTANSAPVLQQGRQLDIFNQIIADMQQKLKEINTYVTQGISDLINNSEFTGTLSQFIQDYTVILETITKTRQIKSIQSFLEVLNFPKFLDHYGSFYENYYILKKHFNQKIARAEVGSVVSNITQQSIDGAQQNISMSQNVSQSESDEEPTNIILVLLENLDDKLSDIKEAVTEGINSFIENSVFLDYVDEFITNYAEAFKNLKTIQKTKANIDGYQLLHLREISESYYKFLMRYEWLTYFLEHYQKDQNLTGSTVFEDQAEISKLEKQAAERGWASLMQLLFGGGNSNHQTNIQNTISSISNATEHNSQISQQQQTGGLNQQESNLNISNGSSSQHISSSNSEHQFVSNNIESTESSSTNNQQNNNQQTMGTSSNQQQGSTITINQQGSVSNNVNQNNVNQQQNSGTSLEAGHSSTNSEKEEISGINDASSSSATTNPPNQVVSSPSNFPVSSINHQEDSVTSSPTNLLTDSLTSNEKEEINQGDIQVGYEHSNQQNVSTSVSSNVNNNQKEETNMQTVSSETNQDQNSSLLTIVNTSTNQQHTSTNINQTLVNTVNQQANTSVSNSNSQDVSNEQGSISSQYDLGNNLDKQKQEFSPNDQLEATSKLGINKTEPAFDKQEFEPVTVSTITKLNELLDILKELEDILDSIDQLINIYVTDEVNEEENQSSNSNVDVTEYPNNAAPEQVTKYDNNANTQQIDNANMLELIELLKEFDTTIQTIKSVVTEDKSRYQSTKSNTNINFNSLLELLNEYEIAIKFLSTSATRGVNNSKFNDGIKTLMELIKNSQNFIKSFSETEESSNKLKVTSCSDSNVTVQVSSKKLVEYVERVFNEWLSTSGSNAITY